MRTRVSRKDVLKSIAAIPAAGAAMMTAIQPAEAIATLSKHSAGYQDKPHKGQECAGCKYFIPGKAAKGDGTCQIVQGSIDPHAWCRYFDKK